MVKGQIENLLVPRLEKDCILSDIPKLESLHKTDEKEVIEVSPCTSERGKVNAEISLSKSPESVFLDGEILCLLLESYKNHFAEMKCSHKLGVGRVMWKAHRIYIYESGKLKIRYAHDRRDALKTLNSILRLTLSSINCKKCNQPAIECVLDDCETCGANESPQTVKIDEYFNGPLLLNGLESLKEAFKRARKQREKFYQEDDSWPSESENKVKRKLYEAIEYSMNFSSETPELENLIISVELIALARKNLKLLENNQLLSQKLSQKNDSEDLDKIRKLAKDIIEAVWKINEDLVKSIDEKNQEIRNDVEKRILETQEKMKRIRDISKRKKGIKNIGKILDGLEKDIQSSKNFLKKIKT